MKKLSSKILFSSPPLLRLVKRGAVGTLLPIIAMTTRTMSLITMNRLTVAPGVTLGNEDAHIEFLVNAEAGTVTAWFYKPHMANFLRMKLESFDVLAKREGGDAKLVFEAVANPVTGETVGNTSKFLAKADWLVTPGRLMRSCQR